MISRGFRVHHEVPRPAEEAVESLLLALLPRLPWLPTLSLASVFSVTGRVAGCNEEFAN